MSSVIEIFGKEIPIYGLSWIVGVALSALLAVLLAKKHGVERYDVVYSAVYIMIGALVGAKLLFLATSLKQIIETNAPFMSFIRGGFVFYGGLIGGTVGLIIYTRQYKLSTLKFSDLFAIVLPLGHSLGRVGCFFGGCCYGIPYDGPLSCMYTETMGNTPLNVPLLPIQLIEAAILFLLFASLFILWTKKAKDGTITLVYFVAYAIIRFILEYFRGDMDRGHLFIFSTSQIISLLFLAGIAVYFVYRKRKQARM